MLIRKLCCGSGVGRDFFSPVGDTRARAEDGWLEAGGMWLHRAVLLAVAVAEDCNGIELIRATDERGEESRGRETRRLRLPASLPASRPRRA